MTSREPSLGPDASAQEASDAFREVYREHFPLVWRMARRLGVPAPGMDDVCQDVFLTVYRRLPDFEGRSSVRSWVIGILYNVVLVHRRTFLRKSTSLRNGDHPGPDFLPDGGRDPEEQTSLREDARVAERSLEQLDEGKRTVLILVELEELSVPEVAEALGMNVNTVAARLRAARKEFAACVTRQRAKERWRLL